MRLTVNKVMQIAIPLAFGTLGTAFGVYPVFWANAVFLALRRHARPATRRRPAGRSARV